MTSATSELEKPDTHGSDVTESETAPSYDDINTPVILMVGVISIVLTLCTIFFVQGLYYQWQNSYVRERSYDYVNEPVRQIVEGQKKMLQGDAAEGIKPVSETMNEVIEEFGKK
ncbi:MAG: hypothetical protein AAGA30_08300 [Planctomycetota bacterium]